MNKVYKASRKSMSVATSPSKQSLEVIITDHSVIYKRGIISKKSEEIPFSKINSVNVKQSLMERSLGYGDVIIMTGNDVNGIVLDNINDPQGLKNDIMAKIHSGNGLSSEQVENTVDLEKLAEWKEKGIITSEEFEAKKKQILGL